MHRLRMIQAGKVKDAYHTFLIHRIRDPWAPRADIIAMLWAAAVLIFFGFFRVIFLPSMARILLLQAKKRPKSIKYLLSLFGFWNLDFFRSFDLGIFLRTDTLQTLALDIAVGVYPLLRTYDSLIHNDTFV